MVNNRAEKQKEIKAQQYKKMQKYENNIVSMDMFPYAGVDEAGRGPLAGPVVAAAVILPLDCNIIGINDSKKMSEKQREEIYEQITASASSIATASVEPAVIDQINIYHASYLAMRRAVEMLPVKPKILMIDGPAKIPGIEIKQLPIVGGDGLCLSIAAASIIAKVTRDRLMIMLENDYPGYGFSRHKGYPTALHRQALRRLGPSSVHRMSFTLLPGDD